MPAQRAPRYRRTLTLSWRAIAYTPQSSCARGARAAIRSRLKLVTVAPQSETCPYGRPRRVRRRRLGPRLVKRGSVVVVAMRILHTLAVAFATIVWDRPG